MKALLLRTNNHGGSYWKPSGVCTGARRPSRVLAAVILTHELSHALFPQAPDAKKEEFRSYLGRSGVIDALTKGAQIWSVAKSP